MQIKGKDYGNDKDASVCPLVFNLIFAFVMFERTGESVDDDGDGNRLRTIASGKRFEFKTRVIPTRERLPATTTDYYERNSQSACPP